MKRVLLLLVILIVLITVVAPASAQDAITITSNKFTNKFPTQLLFQIEAQSAAKINDIALTIQLDGASSSARQVPQFDAGTKISATWEWHLGRNYIPPGVNGQFWWTLKDEAGNTK